MDTKQAIIEGKTALGIEFGSSRIKAVLIDDKHKSIATGEFDWENKLEDGVWTYHIDEVWTGLQNSFRTLASDVQNRYGVPLKNIGAIGLSAMMHGYLVFDKEERLLVPFRTWRNTMTEQASKELTDLFQYNIPQRFSIAHLYQAILNKEAHIKHIAFMTTLAGYVHWKLTGKKVLGLDDASGMFPIDSTTNDYNSRMIQQFDKLISPLGYPWKTKDILPTVLCAGDNAGVLSTEGAKLLDPDGQLQPGIPLCPAEGDAGTGMVATNSVTERTGNISAGTSIFAMIVLEKELSRVYPEIDMVVTPVGKPVAMVHCNNCTTDIDSWVKLFGELIDITGAKIKKATLYDTLYFKALEGEDDCGGLLSYNYHSGEHLTGLEQGRPLFVRTPDSRFSLANFMRTILFSSMGTLKLGMDILTENEKVRIDNLLGHGGLFKTEKVGQQLMAGALNIPVSVLDSAGEGGAWGIALLAAYMLRREKEETLESYLGKKVFVEKSGTRIEPVPKDVEGFKKFMKHFTAGLEIERTAVAHL